MGIDPDSKTNDPNSLGIDPAPMDTPEFRLPVCAYQADNFL